MNRVVFKNQVLGTVRVQEFTDNKLEHSEHISTDKAFRRMNELVADEWRKTTDTWPRMVIFERVGNREKAIN